MPSKLQNIIDLLCNGKCHTLDELQKETNLNESQIEAAVEFLVDYAFAEMNKGIEVRITGVAEKLFK